MLHKGSLTLTVGVLILLTHGSNVKCRVHTDRDILSNVDS